MIIKLKNQISKNDKFIVESKKLNVNTFDEKLKNGKKYTAYI